MDSMKSKMLTLSLAAIAGAFVLSATPAQAGDHHHHHRHDDGCNHGGYYGGRGYGGYYYRPVQYYRPVEYYRPAPRYYAPAPLFSFFFGSGGCR